VRVACDGVIAECDPVLEEARGGEALCEPILVAEPEVDIIIVLPGLRAVVLEGGARNPVVFFGEAAIKV
jgi:hypothetical protein